MFTDTKLDPRGIAIACEAALLIAGGFLLLVATAHAQVSETVVFPASPGYPVNWRDLGIAAGTYPGGICFSTSTGDVLVTSIDLFMSRAHNAADTDDPAIGSPTTTITLWRSSAYSVTSTSFDPSPSSELVPLMTWTTSTASLPKNAYHSGFEWYPNGADNQAGITATKIHLELDVARPLFLTQRAYCLLVSWPSAATSQFHFIGQSTTNTATGQSWVEGGTGAWTVPAARVNKMTAGSLNGLFGTGGITYDTFPDNPYAYGLLGVSSSSITFACPDLGFFTPMCDAMVWFFVPDVSDIGEAFTTTTARFKTKVPYGWFDQVATQFATVSSTQAQTSTAFTLQIPAFSGHATSSLAVFDFNAIQAYIPASLLATIRALGGVAMWALLGTWLWSVVTGSHPAVLPDE